MNWLFARGMAGDRARGWRDGARGAAAAAMLMAALVAYTVRKVMVKSGHEQVKLRSPCFLFCLKLDMFGLLMEGRRGRAGGNEL